MDHYPGMHYFCHARYFPPCRSKSASVSTQFINLFLLHPVGIAYEQDAVLLDLFVDEEFENTKDVNETLVFAGNKILNAFLDETISEIRISNKCRIFDKVAVKINQWALEKIDESHPLKNLIEKNIEKFTPQK